jgi:DNA-binding NarL/FixJ family response regulator
MVENQEYHKPRGGFADDIQTVFLTCFRSEFTLAATVLRYSAIGMHRAETLTEADFLLTVTAGTVLLCDVMFLDGFYQDAIRMSTNIHPFVTSLIVADDIDQPLIADAYRRGALGVLWKPMDFVKAIDLIRTADQATRDRAFYGAVSRHAGVGAGVR